MSGRKQVHQEAVEGVLFLGLWLLIFAKNVDNECTTMNKISNLHFTRRACDYSCFWNSHWFAERHKQPQYYLEAHTLVDN